MGLKKDQILKILTQRYQTETPRLLNEVAYNLALASTTEANLDARASRAFDKLRGLVKPNQPLTEAATRQEANQISVCPVCKCKMKTVKLLDDRNAFYCHDHKIVVPFPSQDQIDELEADV